MFNHRTLSAFLVLMIAVAGVSWNGATAAPRAPIQSIIIGGRENVSQTDIHSEAPQAAASGSSLKVIWNDRTPPDNSNFDDYVYVKEKQTGVSGWPGASLLLDEGTLGKNQFSDITISPDGTTHIVYETSNRVYHRSKPNGGTWSGRHVVADESEANPARITAAPNGLLWIVYREKNGAAIRYRVSSNGGLSWGGSDVATQSGNMFAPDIAVGPDSVPHIVWYLRSVNPNGGFRYADWNGNGWTTGAGGSGYGADPSIAVDRNNIVHVAYRQQTGGGWNIVHAARAPGQGWGSENIRTTNGDAAYGPGIAADDAGRVHVTWSELTGGNASVGRDLWYSYKEPGLGFSPPTSVSENPGGWNSRSTIATTTGVDGSSTAHIFYQHRERRGDPEADEIFYRTYTFDPPIPPQCRAGTPVPPTRPASTLPRKIYLPIAPIGCGF